MVGILIHADLSAMRNLNYRFYGGLLAGKGTKLNPHPRNFFLGIITRNKATKRECTLVADILVRGFLLSSLEVDTVSPTNYYLSSNLTATLVTKSANPAFALVPATTLVVIVVWGAGAVAVKVSFVFVVRKLAVVVATKRAAGGVVIVDTVGAGALEPAEERDTSSIMDELARTIVGS